MGNKQGIWPPPPTREVSEVHAKSPLSFKGIVSPFLFLVALLFFLGTIYYGPGTNPGLNIPTEAVHKAYEDDALLCGIGCLVFWFLSFVVGACYWRTWAGRLGIVLSVGAVIVFWITGFLADGGHYP